MINFEAFAALTETVNKYHNDLLKFENNLNVSIESNWMTQIMDSIIHALARAFHKDDDFQGWCYQELTSGQVKKIEEFLHYFIYSWECGEQPPAWIVYERIPTLPTLEGNVKKECKCAEDAYEIIVDYLEHFQDEFIWRLEDI